jgi:PAS domain-containing protein
MDGSTAQKPLELILARNLLASLSTPGFLIDVEGQIIFFNEAAGAVLGRRFEETGRMRADEWLSTFGPFGDDGEPIPFTDLELTRALKGDRAAHAKFSIRSAQGQQHRVEASGLPIVGVGGFHGALIVFWEDDE